MCYNSITSTLLHLLNKAFLSAPSGKQTQKRGGKENKKNEKPKGFILAVTSEPNTNTPVSPPVLPDKTTIQTPLDEPQISGSLT